MAEVVGLVASVATLIEVSLKLGKLLSRFRDAPDELLALSNEITDLRFLFAEIEKIVRERPDSMTRFSSTLDTAERRVEAVLRFFQKVDAFDTTITDRHGSLNRQFEALEWLIQVGGDPFIGDEGGLTVLTLAGVWAAHQRVLGNTLPEAADNFCQLSALDEDWDLSEIHEVILQLSHKPLADVLVDPSSEINATDAYGRTAVWWAALLDIEDALRTLLENGADPNIHSTIHDLAPLGAATSTGCIELLLRYGANVKEVDRAKRNILQLWTDDDDLEPEPYNDYVWIRKFIRTCTDRGIHIDARDSQGYTALANTVYYNHHSVLEVFLKLGADYTIRTNRNETVLHIAARRGDTRTLAILAGHKLPGIDLDARTTTGRETALKTFESLKECKSPDEIRTFYHLWRVVSLNARGTDVVAELGSEEETWTDESENQREGNIDDDDGDSDFFEDAPEF
ncbi:hypothetical protein GTA08_BOTSDO13383 [Botryosphaeria dothidea]|uniref:Ankyrin repeat protein n=1 Tax=Botryosphaeria dothidea TaxID=55169 RepID=A0A8H4J0M8_9PEZI|nr:hypothetical protein GTA08_BOTSDO13383 [Botryosphaeria dothidea]